MLLLLQNSWIRQQFVAEVGHASKNWLSDSLSIGSIEESLWGKITLNQVKLYQDADTILEIDQIRLRFQMLPLFRKTIHVDTLTITGIKAKTITAPNLGVNWARLARPSAPDTLPSSPFTWHITLPFIQLTQGSATLEGFSPMLPSQVDSIEIQGAFEMKSDTLMVQIHRLGAIPNQHWPRIQQLDGLLTIASQYLNLKNLHVTTCTNRMQAEARYANLSNFQSALQWNNPNPSEFSFALPNLTFARLDSVSLQVRNHSDTLLLRVALRRETQAIELSGQFENLAQLHNSSAAKTPFEVELKLRNVRVSDWLEQLPKEIVAHGKLQLRGEGFNYQNQAYHLRGNLTGSSYRQIKPGNLMLLAEKTADSASVQIESRWNQSPIALRARIHKIFENPFAQIQLTVSNFQFASIDSGLPVCLNRAAITYTGKLDAAPSGEGTVEIQNMEAYALPPVQLNARYRLTPHGVHVDTLVALHPSLNTGASGDFWFRTKELAANAQMKITRWNFTHDSTTVSVESGTIKAHAKGTISNLQWGAEGDLNHIQSDSITLEQFDLQASGSYQPHNLAAEVHTSLKNGQWGSYLLNRLSLKASLNKNLLNARLEGTLLDSVQFALQGTTTLHDTLKLEANELMLGTQTHSICNKGPLKVSMNNQTLAVESFQLQLVQDTTNALALHGVLTDEGASDFTLQVKSFNMKHLQPFFYPMQLPGGSLTAQLQLNGTPNRHRVKGTLEWNAIRYAGYEIHRVRQELELNNQRACLRTQIFNHMNENLAIDARASYLLVQDSTGFKLAQEPSFEIETQGKEIPLYKFISNTPNLKFTGGMLSWHLWASGPVHYPQLNGFISLESSGLQIPSGKFDLKEFQCNVRFLGDRVVVDTLRMQSGKGSLWLSGMADFDSSLVTTRLEQLEMNLKSSQFRLNHAGLFDFTLDADAGITTVKQTPVLDGQIKIIHGEVNLDEFLASDRPTTYHKNAMLIQALHPAPASTPVAPPPPTAENTMDPTLLFQKLTGRINLNIPRNMWIKGEGTALELNGDLDMVKTGDDFELFGKLSIQRGYYTLSGRRLNILKGDLNFQGGEGINPALAIEAQYTFRGSSKTKQNLLARIGGSLSEPEVNFLLDHKEISQADAVAYLVFGKSMDELGSGSQNDMSEATTGEAVASMLTSELTQVVANKLKLDVFEFEADDNWENAAFLVGKYITNNLFVVYQRSFGKASDNELTPETITLEYELNKHLFFRLQSGEEKTSGVDVILKFESKP